MTNRHHSTAVTAKARFQGKRQPGSHLAIFMGSGRHDQNGAMVRGASGA
jgi:hypothetical protein